LLNPHSAPHKIVKRGRMKAHSILNEVSEKIGNKSFCTANDLIEIGLFGSHNAVLVALRRGDLPYLKVSSRRLIIPKKDLIKFIERNFKDTRFQSEDSCSLK
jgi:hypothetical protein